jgi:dihydrofolate reductase
MHKNSQPLVISMIAAIGQKREIGNGNALLWKIKADLQNFKQVTLGHMILMGRATYESVGRPLPGRTNVVLTRQEGYEAPGCVVVHSLEAALAYAAEKGETELFVCGGGEIYTQLLPQATRLYLSLIEDTKEADAYFPAWQPEAWRVELDVGFPSVEGAPAWRYQVLERK